MGEFYVFHYTQRGRVPKITFERQVELTKAMHDALAQYPAIEYKGTMYDPDTRIGVSRWEAPNASELEDLLGLTKVPYDKVVPVVPLSIGRK